MHTERRGRYTLIEAKEIAVDTGSPRAIAHYVDVDFQTGTIELPEGKFDLANFLRVAEAIHERY